MAEIGIDRTGFRPSYRPERPAGLDPEMKRMGVMAAGIGGVLALLVGGAWLIRPAHHGVPVVEADPTPVRVKPLNPGGMQVTGSDFGAPSTSGPHLAPAAEQPELSVLHQQVRTMQKEIAKQAAANAQALKLAQEAAAHPKIAAAAPIQRASATAMITAPAPVSVSALPRLAEALPAATSSGTDVQFAAFTDEAAARTEWDALVKKSPQLLGGRKPEITRADAAGRTMWRLRTGGFNTVAEAASFCAKMRAQGADCSIAAF
jgi:hypothetical protein